MHYVKYCTRAWVKRKYSTRQSLVLYISLRPHQSAKFHKVLSGKWLFRRILLNRSSLLAFCVLGNGILSTNTTQIFYTLEWAIRLAMATTMTCCSARRTSRPQRRESSDFVAEPSAKRQHLSLKLSKKKAPFCSFCWRANLWKSIREIEAGNTEASTRLAVKNFTAWAWAIVLSTFLTTAIYPSWLSLCCPSCYYLLLAIPFLQPSTPIRLLLATFVSPVDCALSLCNCVNSLMHFQGFCLQLIYWLPVLYISSLFTP